MCVICIIDSTKRLRLTLCLQENEIIPDSKKPKMDHITLLKKPRLTIASLCTMAFKYFPSGVGTVDDIYQFFGFIFPYYKNDPKGQLISD